MLKVFKSRNFGLLSFLLTLSFLILFSSCKKATTGPSETIYMNVSPSVIDFGAVAVNSFKEMRLMIKNERNSSGNLTGSITVSGDGFSLMSGSQFSLAPGESIYVYVRFSPTAGATYNGTLSISHNATNLSSPKTVQLTGVGDAVINQIISLIQSGWQSFRDKNYNDALSKFDQAISLARTSSRYDSLQAEAECGRGWTRAFNRDFALAKNDFLNSLAHQSVSTSVSLNSKAGLAFVHHALNEFPSAIQRALEVLNVNQNYVFEYDSRIYYKRLRLVLAQSYYTLGDFQNSALQLDIIDPTNAPHSTDPTVLLRQIQDLWGRI